MIVDLGNPVISKYLLPAGMVHGFEEKTAEGVGDGTSQLGREGSRGRGKGVKTDNLHCQVSVPINHQARDAVPRPPRKPALPRHHP